MMGRGIARKRAAAVAGAAVLAGVAVLAGTASGTPSSGVSATSVRGHISEEIKINTKAIKLHTKEPLDVITQTAFFEPGGTSGWHTHPGPVFVTVVTGTVTVYDASCKGRSYSAGEGFMEGPEPAVVRNEGTEVSKNVATLLVPAGTAARTESPSLCPGIQ